MALQQKLSSTLILKMSQMAPAKSLIVRFVNLFKLLVELILSSVGVTLCSYTAIAIMSE